MATISRHTGCQFSFLGKDSMPLNLYKSLFAIIA